jgi:hypothetical protein
LDYLNFTTYGILAPLRWDTARDDRDSDHQQAHGVGDDQIKSITRASDLNRLPRLPG